MFDSFDISVSGMVAHRIWMDTTQANVANMHTTRDEAGRPNPYKRRFPVFMADTRGGGGVRIAEIGQDDEVKWVRNPGHKDAVKSGPNAGMVRMPNVELSVEMVNALIAQRAYEANLTALNVTKQMYMSDLRILG